MSKDVLQRFVCPACVYGLVSEIFSNDGGGQRGTSTTREDTGDGACETIFVDRFQIVKAATNYWRMSMVGFLVFFGINLIVYFKRPYRPY